MRGEDGLNCACPLLDRERATTIPDSASSRSGVFRLYRGTATAAPLRRAARPEMGPPTRTPRPRCPVLVGAVAASPVPVCGSDAHPDFCGFSDSGDPGVYA